MKLKRLAAFGLSAAMILTPIAETNVFSYITAYANVSVTETDYGALTVSSDTTINLASGTKRIYSTITIKSGCTLTIKGAGYMEVTSVTGSGDLVVNSGNVTLLGITCKNTTINGGNVEVNGDITAAYYGNVIFKGGTSKIVGNVSSGSGDYYSSEVYLVAGNVETYSPAVVNITGNVTGGKGFIYYYANSTRFAAGGDVLIDDGTTIEGNVSGGEGGVYHSKSYNNYYSSGGNVTIKGGIINGDISGGTNKSDTTGGSVTISGGKIKSDKISVGTGTRNGTLTVNGTAYIEAETLPTDLSKVTSGIINKSGDITVYGAQTITEPMTLDEFGTLEIKSSALLLVDGTTLTVDGTLLNNGKIKISEEATLAGSGTIDSASTGTITKVIPFDENAITTPDSFTYNAENAYDKISITSDGILSDALGGVTMDSELPKDASAYNLEVTYSETKDGEYSIVTEAKDAGYYKVNLTDTETQTTFSKSFEISKADITSAMVTIEDGSYYQNTLTNPTVTVKKGNTTLTEDEDYSVTFSSDCSVGTGVATITGIGGYDGTITKDYHIHIVVTTPAKASTCSETGLTAGLKCSICGEVIKAQNVTTKKAHTVVTDEAVAPTCTEDGLTEGTHCSVCNEVITAQEVVPATNHTIVIDKAVAPTCTQTGLTEGSHCSVCNAVITAQEVIPATGHTVVVDKAVASTCSKTGLTEGSHCSVCKTVIKAQETVPTKAHTVVVDKAVAATCTATGLTEGSHCSVCGTVIKAQETVAAKGHTVVIDKGVAQTGLNEGLTEGSHCSVCGTVIKKQEVIEVPDSAIQESIYNTYKAKTDKLKQYVKANGTKSSSGTYTLSWNSTSDTYSLVLDSNDNLELNMAYYSSKYDTMYIFFTTLDGIDNDISFGEYKNASTSSKKLVFAGTWEWNPKKKSVYTKDSEFTVSDLTDSGSYENFMAITDVSYSSSNYNSYRKVYNTAASAMFNTMISYFDTIDLHNAGFCLRDVGLTIYHGSASVTYQTHIQNIGWQGNVSNGAMSGTSGKAYRLEGIKISLSDVVGTSGSILYRTHVQDYGWMDWVQDGAMSGTSGQSKRLEAIQIKLSGTIATYFDVYYRVHAQNVGWLAWAKNGESAGTAGYSYRLEAIQIVLVPKGETFDVNQAGIKSVSTYSFVSSTGNTRSSLCPGVSYQTQVQNKGWQSAVSDGASAGTVGSALRLESIKINLTNNTGISGGIQYRTHIQNIGWESSWKSNGALSGTVGKSLRLEAIQIKLTGEMAEKYDVYYRVHAQNFGWLGWAKNGASAGTAGYSYRLEAIQIVLVPKGGTAPGSTANSFKQK